MPDSYWKKVSEAKSAYRDRAAALPFAEKLERLEKLRAQSVAIRGGAPRRSSVVPRIDSCLVCEAVRRDQSGELIIQGFLGICPNAEVAVSQLDQPTTLTFVFSGTGGDGFIALTFDVLDEASGRVIASTSPLPFQATSKATELASTLSLRFGNTGPYAVRCHMDGVERFRAHFQVSQGKAN